MTSMNVSFMVPLMSDSLHLSLSHCGSVCAVYNSIIKKVRMTGILNALSEIYIYIYI